MDENRQELIAIGADDFISKPFREVDLFQKIHAHVGVEYVYAEPPTAPAQEDGAELAPESLAGCPQDLIHAGRVAAFRQPDPLRPLAEVALKLAAADFDLSADGVPVGAVAAR